jgi:hypothetical protein
MILFILYLHSTAHQYEKIRTISKHTEKQRPQDRSLSISKEGERNPEKKRPENVGWPGNYKTSLHNHQKSSNTKLIKKQGIRNKVSCIAKIEINGIRVMLRAD